MPQAMQVKSHIKQLVSKLLPAAWAICSQCTDWSMCAHCHCRIVGSTDRTQAPTTEERRNHGPCARENVGAEKLVHVVKNWQITYKTFQRVPWLSFPLVRIEHWRQSQCDAWPYKHLSFVCARAIPIHCGFINMLLLPLLLLRNGRIECAIVWLLWVTKQCNRFHDTATNRLYLLCRYTGLAGAPRSHCRSRCSDINL